MQLMLHSWAPLLNTNSGASGRRHGSRLIHVNVVNAVFIELRYWTTILVWSRRRHERRCVHGIRCRTPIRVQVKEDMEVAEETHGAHQGMLVKRATISWYRFGPYPSPGIAADLSAARQARASALLSDLVAGNRSKCDPKKVTNQLHTAF